MDDLCTLRGLDQLGKMCFCKDMTMQLRKKKKNLKKLISMKLKYIKTSCGKAVSVAQEKYEMIVTRICNFQASNYYTVAIQWPSFYQPLIESVVLQKVQLDFWSHLAKALLCP